MKLGLVVPGLEFQGGVPAVARFIKDAALRSGRYDLTLISLSMSSDDPTSLNFRRPASWARGVTGRTGIWEGLPFTHVGARGGEFEFQRYKPRKYLAELLAECDLVQVVAGSPAWANAVIGLGRPVALQCATRARIERRLRDAHPQSLPAWWRKAMTALTDRYDDLALRSVDAIQVENHWMLEYAQRLNTGREIDIRYAPPGINGVIFHPPKSRDLGARPYILCVARLDDPRKNIELLLRAYSMLPQPIITQVQLVLAGSAAPPPHFWEQADAAGLRERITYIARPSQDALIELYQQASAFVLPSDEEGLGVVLLEAMACGVPPISTRSGGPDGIISDGVDGFLVPLDDAEAMADRLERLLSDQQLNLDMGRCARATIDRRFTEEVTGDAFVEMWDRLIHRVQRE